MERKFKRLTKFYRKLQNSGTINNNGIDPQMIANLMGSINSLGEDVGSSLGSLGSAGSVGGATGGVPIGSIIQGLGKVTDGITKIIEASKNKNQVATTTTPQGMPIGMDMNNVLNAYANGGNPYQQLKGFAQKGIVYPNIGIYPNIRNLIENLSYIRRNPDKYSYLYNNEDNTTEDFNNIIREGTNYMGDYYNTTLRPLKSNTNRNTNSNTSLDTNSNSEDYSDLPSQEDIFNNNTSYIKYLSKTIPIGKEKMNNNNIDEENIYHQSPLKVKYNILSGNKEGIKKGNNKVLTEGKNTDHNLLNEIYEEYNNSQRKEKDNSEDPYKEIYEKMDRLNDAEPANPLEDNSNSAEASNEDNNEGNKERGYDPIKAQQIFGLSQGLMGAIHGAIGAIKGNQAFKQLMKILRNETPPEILSRVKPAEKSDLTEEENKIRANTLANKRVLERNTGDLSTLIAGITNLGKQTNEAIQNLQQRENERYKAEQERVDEQNARLAMKQQELINDWVEEKRRERKAALSQATTAGHRALIANLNKGLLVARDLLKLKQNQYSDVDTVNLYIAARKREVLDDLEKTTEFNYEIDPKTGLPLKDENGNFVYTTPEKKEKMRKEALMNFENSSEYKELINYLNRIKSYGLFAKKRDKQKEDDTAQRGRKISSILDESNFRKILKNYTRLSQRNNNDLYKMAYAAHLIDTENAKESASSILDVFKRK